MNNAKAAKNLLNETSCYQCVYYHNYKKHCKYAGNSLRLPNALNCKNFIKAIKFNVKWFNDIERVER